MSDHASDVAPDASLIESSGANHPKALPTPIPEDWKAGRAERAHDWFKSAVDDAQRYQEFHQNVATISYACNLPET